MTPALIPLGTSPPAEDQNVPTKDHWLRGSRHVARTSTSIGTREEPQGKLDPKDQKPSLKPERHLEQEIPIFNEKENKVEPFIDSGLAIVLDSSDQKEDKFLSETLDIPQINKKHTEKEGIQKNPINDGGEISKGGNTSGNQAFLLTWTQRLQP